MQTLDFSILQFFLLRYVRVVILLFVSLWFLVRGCRGFEVDNGVGYQFREVIDLFVWSLLRLSRSGGLMR